MTRALGIVALLLVAALAGCIENMSDLKDRVQGSNTDTVQPPVDANATLKNATKKSALAPVARMDIYGAGGVKMYEADFTAVDAEFKDATPVAGDKLRFVGSGSEVLDKNATLSGYDWAFGDGKTAKGSTVEHAFETPAGGVFQVVLTVTDSKGRTDTQKIKLAVMPSARVVVNESAEGSIDAPLPKLPSPVGDAQPTSNSQSFPFSIVGKVDGKDVKHLTTTVTVTGTSPGAADLDLAILDSEGTVVATSTAGGTTETITLEGLEPMDLTAVVTLSTGAQATFTLAFDSVYEPVNHDVLGYLGGGAHHG